MRCAAILLVIGLFPKDLYLGIPLLLPFQLVTWIHTATNFLLFYKIFKLFFHPFKIFNIHTNIFIKKTFCTDIIFKLNINQHTHPFSVSNQSTLLYQCFLVLYFYFLTISINQIIASTQGCSVKYILKMVIKNDFKTH